VIRGAAGTRPVIDLKNSGELHIGASYCLFENLEIVNGKGNNIHVIPGSTTVPITNLIIRNVVSHKMASGTGAVLKMAGNWNNGTGVPTEYVYVENCELAGSIDNACLDCVALRNSVVRNSWLHDPVVVSMHSPGVFFKGGSNNILIENNLVSGINGNGAIMIGGDTGAQWFDGLYYNPKVEGVNEVVRNNILANFNDSAFEIRGTHGAKIYHNTVVTPTSFCIFRLTWGGSGSGTQIGNYNIDMTDNLILSYGNPAYAENSGNSDATLHFGPQFWGGSFGASSGPGVPRFPQASDKTVPSTANFGSVVMNPSYTSLTGLSDALGRYPLATGSPAKNAGAANTVAPLDILGVIRSTTAPSIGAFE
jgi:hypothetical protein